MTKTKVTTTDDAGRRTSFEVRPETPLGQLFTIARADRNDDDAQLNLEALARIAELRSWLDTQADGHALNGRRNGATWAQIGEALGITRQAAHMHWGNITQDPAIGLVDALVELAERPDLLTGPAE